MNISEKGLEIIKKYEGFNPEKYICPAGKWTIGYGHTLKAGEDFTTVTKEEAEELLRRDVKALEFMVTQLVTVTITQSQFDALISLVYNWGIGKFIKSKGLKKLNKGDYAGAVDEFFNDRNLMGVKDANYPGGIKILRGLELRRHEEKELFNATTA